jgi:hypothetical protein
VQLGSEVGLRPMQALQNIAVINGRPAVWGDALPGLCKASPVYHDIIETWEHEQDLDLLTAVCIAKRHGSTPVTARFSVMDAKRAGLWTKAGPWLAAWAKLVRGCKAARALDKLQTARQTNQAHIAAVAAFDPEPAATLTAQLDRALSVARQDA